jgi:bifunctional ADP-heptose synthase (sugar kinase/adenylyltransferase)
VDPLAERLFVLAHLECVDLVTWFDEDTPYELLAEVLPDVWPRAGTGRGEDRGPRSGGSPRRRVAILPSAGYSTTGTLARIAARPGR